MDLSRLGQESASPLHALREAIARLNNATQLQLVSFHPPYARLICMGREPATGRDLLCIVDAVVGGYLIQLSERAAVQSFARAEVENRQDIRSGVRAADRHAMQVIPLVPIVVAGGAEELLAHVGFIFGADLGGSGGVPANVQEAMAGYQGYYGAPPRPPHPPGF